MKVPKPGAREGVAVIVNLDNCIGCRACQIACQEWNGRKAVKTQFSPTFTNPQDLTADSWKVVFFKEFSVTKLLRLAEGDIELKDTVEVVPVPYNCMHCADSPCARACPVGAIKVSPEGAVVIESSECVGCGYCLAACPYDVPRKGSDGKYYKCSFCVDRIQVGREPACVEVCPTNVFTFTSMSEAEKLLASEFKDKKVYGLNLDGYVGGRTRWIFVASKDAADKVFPAMFPEKAENVNEVRDLANEFALPGLGVLALGMLGLLGLAWLRYRRNGSH
ncbi:MAG: 4Fe-4S dicluster domain-containing protein [Acidilobaceae archaeon]|nr:4Fe-4S dicluster domain-containing protein [Acidilobaceae archaeon]MDW7974594.1 4Fe-4S dicluster domain-containing protein [Sulfolobales archaeon]